jgi:hypothetical protein
LPGLIRKVLKYNTLFFETYLLVEIQLSYDDGKDKHIVIASKVPQKVDYNKVITASINTAKAAAANEAAAKAAAEKLVADMIELFTEIEIFDTPQEVQEYIEDNAKLSYNEDERTNLYTLTYNENTLLHNTFNFALARVLDIDQTRPKDKYIDTYINNQIMPKINTDKKIQNFNIPRCYLFNIQQEAPIVQPLGPEFPPRDWHDRERLEFAKCGYIYADRPNIEEFQNIMRKTKNMEYFFQPVLPEFAYYQPLYNVENESDSGITSDVEHGGSARKKRLCKNGGKKSAKKMYYYGDEASPLGRGYAACFEEAGTKKKGKDGKLYFVAVNSNQNKIWKKFPKVRSASSSAEKKKKAKA